MNLTVITPFDDISREKLEKVASGVRITYAFDQTLPHTQPQAFNAALYQEALLAADMVIGQPPVDMLTCMPRLRLLQLTMAGTEPYSRPGVLSPNVALCNASGAFGKAISEHMLACTLMLIKKLHLYRDNMQQHAWRDMGQVTSLSDMTVLCVGLGDIGSRYAALCKAMGAKVIGVRRSGTDKPGYVDEVYLQSSLDELLPQADVVALSLPNTPQTAGLFSADRIARMKPGALLLNVGRGNAVDTNALYEALQSGKLSGAALDVTDPEPLPEAHPLWDCENAIVTPHISGFFHLRATYDTIVDMAVENVRRFLHDEPYLNAVDRKTGYRVTHHYE
ncbi:MAG: D-2-hydroxyacid dehydrogenase [Eubacteriales bacterium]|nr:D-2-hydroxyacid dehydrogenase [Eubacteriales bacterium]